MTGINHRRLLRGYRSREAQAIYGLESISLGKFHIVVEVAH